MSSNERSIKGRGLDVMQMESLESLKPVFDEEGQVTAGNASRLDSA